MLQSRSRLAVPRLSVFSRRHGAVTGPMLSEGTDTRSNEAAIEATISLASRTGGILPMWIISVGAYCALPASHTAKNLAPAW